MNREDIIREVLCACSVFSEPQMPTTLAGANNFTFAL